MRAEGSNVGLLSGGTDLIIQLRSGRKNFQHMVDIKKIKDLNVLSYSDQTGLRLGSAVTCTALWEYDAARKHYPGLCEGAELIGSTQVQNRCTIGGNVCNGSPAADTPCSLITGNAVMVLHGPNGTREVAAKDFWLGPGKVDLKEAELLVEFKVPPLPKNASSAYLRFIPRNEMDIAVAAASTDLVFEDDKKTVKAARIAIGAVGPLPVLVEEAGAALVGTQLDESALAAAARASEKAANPINDQRGTVEFRIHLAGVLTRRTIAIAAKRAKGEAN